jgi:FAD/FMN-containing dehydrogenase
VVVRPAACEDVAAVLRFAADEGYPVTTRGAGHSQSGQGLGTGIVLDMTSLDRVVSIDPDDGAVEVEAGATWRRVVELTFGRGLLPRGLTHAVDPTVGGTLSVAGVGGETHRFGPQSDNVLSLEVATMRGEVVHCSLRENRALFDAVRSGLGQCGVIVRASYPLRACRRRMTIRVFAYTGVRRFIDDAVQMASSNTDGVWLSGAVGRDPFRPTRSLLLLRVGQETDADGPAPASLAVQADVELPLPHPTKGMWTQDGLPAHRMFHVFGGAPVPGSPVQVLNPWVEGMFSPDGAAAALDGLLARGPGLLAAGRVGVILVRRGEAPAPLFCVPEGDWVVGVGVFSTLPAAARTEACAMASELAIEMHRLGCKRYLSGYFSEEPTFDWSGHYADRWPDFRAAKAEHDPHGLLNSGFIRWQ